MPATRHSTSSSSTSIPWCWRANLNAEIGILDSLSHAIHLPVFPLPSAPSPSPTTHSPPDSTHTPRINPLRQTSLPLSSAIQTPTSTPIPSTSTSISWCIPIPPSASASTVEASSAISPLCSFSNARSYALTSPTRMAAINLPYSRSILGYCAKRCGEGKRPRRSRAGMRCFRMSLGVSEDSSSGL
jgi:hypothetical protein